MERYSAMRKEILPFATTWMDPEGIMVSEISQIEEDEYCVISLICGILKSQPHKNRVEWGLPEAEGWGIWAYAV